MIREDATRPHSMSKWTLNCFQCGKPFDATRRDAKFCSSVCRKASARRKEQITHAANIAVSQIAYIRRMAREYQDLEIAAALQLDRIEQALSVTTAVRTHDAEAIPVTIASGTDKQICPKCGHEVDYISVFTNSCETCIREGMKKTG